MAGKQLNYSRPQFKKAGTCSVEWDEKGRLLSDDAVIRCTACGKLGPRPPVNLVGKVLRCTRCGKRQGIKEMIKAAQ